MKRTFSIWIVAALLVLTSTPFVLGQETTGSISGRVVDAQGLPVPGATVTVFSSQGSKAFVTDDDGRFLAPFLTPGTYATRVELTGFKPVEQKGLDVRLGQRVDLPLQLEVGDVTQVVEVVGSSPVVDTGTTTIGANLDNELFTHVPVGRRFSDTLFLAPGVSSGGGTGDANPSIGGGSGLENQYVIDGVNISNTGFGALGSYSIIFGSLGNGVNFDFVKEVQVKSGGYDAEYGQSTGGVVNVITKSGSNAIRGSLFGYSRPTALEGSFRRLTTPNGSVNVTKTELHDFGAEVGGPVLRNRLFFFGAIDPQFEKKKLIAPEGFPLRRLGEVEQDRKVVSYAAKATWQASNSHRVDASFFGDPANGDNGPQRTNTALLGQDTSAFSRLVEYGGHNQTVKYDGVITPRWLVEASFARAQNDTVEDPSVNQWSIIDTTVQPFARSGGIGFYELLNGGKNRQYQAKSTYLLNFAGSHEIRGGVSYEDIDYVNTIQRTGPTFVLPNGQRTVTGAQVRIQSDPTFGRIFRVTRANTSNTRDTSQDYTTWFAQDTYRIQRLTLNGGVRWEQQELHGNLVDFTLDSNYAWRFGGTYDLLGDGKTKVFAHGGRYYSKIPNDLAARALSADAGVTRADYFDAALTRPVPQGVSALGTTNHFIITGTSASDIDPNVKSGYLNEYIVGGEHELLPKMNVGVRYIHRNIGRLVEDIGTAPLAAFETGAADTVEFFLTNPSPSTPVIPGFGAAHEKGIHDYDAVEFTVDKRFSNNWQVLASYRYAQLEGTFEGFFRNDNGQSDPGITSLFDFPVNDPSFAQVLTPLGARGDVRFLGKAGEGPLPNDRRQQTKIFGNYLFDRWVPGLNVGLGLTFTTGAPLTAFAANTVFDSAGEIPEGPRGSGIQTIDDGFRRRTKLQKEVDLHFDYGRPIGRGMRASGILDIFNVFDLHTVTNYNSFTESGPGVLNPDFGFPTNNVTGIQRPIQVRIGARLQF